MKRECKGNSLIEFPNDYTIIDIVTTGHDFLWDSLIEIGAIRVRNNTKVSVFFALTKLDGLDDFIQEITGINDDDVISAPGLETVLLEFSKFIGDDILVGHAINFDINFLYGKFINTLNIPLSNDYVDTLRLSRKLINIESYTFDNITSYFDLPIREYSRVEVSCSLEFELYNRLKNVALELEDYKSLWKRDYKNRISLKAANIKPDDYIPDTDNILFNKVCVFTGVLEHMSRKAAMQMVVNIGGKVADRVTKETNFLILGNNDYCRSIKDGKSNKQKNALKLKSQGFDIDIISENVFYDVIDE